jgi:hypothetical protein
VDLRRWREERDRRLRQAAAEVEPTAQPALDRISWPFRILALIGGTGFLAFGAFLGALPWLIRTGGGGGAWSAVELLLLLVGGAIALFGIDLAGRGLLAREWTRSFWQGISGWLDRRARPLPLFLGASALLLLPPLWTRSRPSAWEPALYWFVGFLHIGLHELGHLLAVHRVKYTPRLLVAGPLTVQWNEGRRVAGATRDWRWLFGGNVWFEARRRTRARDLAVLLAGPVANLLTLAAVFAVDRGLNGSGLFDVYVRANVLCAAFVLAVNLLPLPRTIDGYATDGRQILDLLRGRRIA